MKEADEFSKQYGEFLLKEFPIIHKVLKEYKIKACLKDTEDKKVFIVERQGKSYVCKMMKDNYLENIKSEYDTLSILSNQSAAFPKPESTLKDENKAKDTCFMGTEVTAPPEQYGYAQTDVRSDIYSLGVLLYYLATGSFNIREVNSSLPKELKKSIKKCTVFAPKDRYSDIKYLEYKLMKLSLSPIFLDNPDPLLKKYQRLQNMIKGFEKWMKGLDIVERKLELDAEEQLERK